MMTPICVKWKMTTVSYKVKQAQLALASPELGTAKPQLVLFNSSYFCWKYNLNGNNGNNESKRLIVSKVLLRIDQNKITLKTPSCLDYLKIHNQQINQEDGTELCQAQVKLVSQPAHLT